MLSLECLELEQRSSELKTGQMKTVGRDLPHHACLERTDNVLQGFRAGKGGRRDFQGYFGGSGQIAACGQKRPSCADVQGVSEFQELLAPVIHAANKHGHGYRKALPSSPFGAKPTSGHTHSRQLFVQYLAPSGPKPLPSVGFFLSSKSCFSNNLAHRRASEHLVANHLCGWKSATFCPDWGSGLRFWA